MPTVSAVIPAYNADGFVHRAIESALAQTHRLLEIIVVDDGSSDDTAAVAARYPVRVIRQANGGPGAARNTGVMAAQGEWIALLDHDDTWHPDKTRQQLALADEGIAAVFSAKFGKREFEFEALYWGNLGGSPSSTLIRRDALLQIGLFDPDRAMMGLDDYHMWLKFLHAGLRFRTTLGLYNFTPSPQHYGGNYDRMLDAELLTFRKIGTALSLPPEKTEARLRKARLDYLPALVHTRRLQAARQQLMALGPGVHWLRFGHAWLPRPLLDLKRTLLRRQAPADGV